MRGGIVSCPFTVPGVVEVYGFADYARRLLVRADAPVRRPERPVGVLTFFFRRVPIVAPFCGCLFGGILYDVFLYTGPDSLVNQPWFGLKDLARPKAAILERMEKHKAEGLV